MRRQSAAYMTLESATLFVFGSHIARRTQSNIVKTGDMQKAANKFSGGQYIGFGECENPYVALNFKRLFDVEDEFSQISHRLLKAVVELAQEQKYADA